MSRGFFNFISSHKLNSTSPKSWYASSIQCDCFWIDLLVNPNIDLDEPEFIKKYLKELKKRVEESLENRFIYMYGSRKKIRFNTTKPFSKSLFFQNIFVNLLIGAQGTHHCIGCDLTTLGISDPKTCRFFVTDNFLNLSQDGKNWVRISVHDFLQICALEDLDIQQLFTM